MIGISVFGKDDTIRRLKPIVDRRAHRRGLERSLTVLVEALKRYPPYRYVPQPFDFSERQRRYVWAMIRAGVITPGRPNRSGELRNSWETVVSGDSAIIVNEAPGAGYVMGDRQTSSHARRGWRQVDEVVRRSEDRFMRSYRSAYDDALAGRGI